MHAFREKTIAKGSTGSDNVRTLQVPTSQSFFTDSLGLCFTKVGALDLWDGVILQLVLEGVRSVKSEAHPRGGTPCAAGALLRGCLADGRNH